MIKQDLKNRISFINDLERQVLQERNRFIRLKKLNKLMSARENLRLQFYTEHIQDLEILKMLEEEANTYIKFQERFIARFKGRSNVEFETSLQSILDTCSQTQFINNKSIISQAKQSFENIYQTIQDTSNIMKNYRLRNVKRSLFILNQYSEEHIENKTGSLECCTGLNIEELGE